jgi:hypothetical protein
LERKEGGGDGGDLGVNRAWHGMQASKGVVEEHLVKENCGRKVSSWHLEGFSPMHESLWGLGFI